MIAAAMSKAITIRYEVIAVAVERTPVDLRGILGNRLKKPLVQVQELEAVGKVGRTAVAYGQAAKLMRQSWSRL